MVEKLKKICLITGSRAEYGLLKSIIKKINNSESLELKLVVTGMHLSSEFGHTFKEIESDGFYINKKVEILLGSDSSISITKSMGLAMISFSEVFDQLRPDLVLILGDRFEIFAAASAAMVACIPIAHIHGGELTEGAIDDAMRHSITKMSHLHFVASAEYKSRVIQLGEQPDKVFNVGSLGIENIKKTKLLSKVELESNLKLKFLRRNLLITFHPTTLESGLNLSHMNNLLNALSSLKDTNLIFTYPNADAEGRILINKLKEFCSKENNARSFASLGQIKYFSCINYVDGVIGNSSSGLIEVPTFKKGTINIGNRQKGRMKANSIIDCGTDTLEIVKAIEKLYSKEFQRDLLKVVNPYGQDNSSSKIIKILESINLNNIHKKSFYDINLDSKL